MSEPTKSWVALIAAFVSKAANAAEKGGAAVAVVGGFTATELAAFGGLAVAILGYVTSQVMNFYFKHQHLKIARAAAKADEEE
jgi:hypothetical protein